jgi:hypothetical protein
MRDSHLLLRDSHFQRQVLLQGTCEHVDIHQPKEGSPCFSVHLHPKGSVKDNLLLLLGILLDALKSRKA